MEIEDAPTVAFVLTYLFMLGCAIVWVISEVYTRWRKAHPKPRQWIYGTLQRPELKLPSRPCRKDPKTGEVQFILWWAGQQGHTEHYWIATDPYWWKYFVPNPSETKKHEN